MSRSDEDRRPDPSTRTPPDHFQAIYQGRAADYHRMISAEDVDGNILAAIEGISSFEGKRVLDIGSGTGRFPLLLQSVASLIVALDISYPMLAENRRQRGKVEGNWDLVQADMGKLPVRRGSFDVVIAGWAIGHQTFWQRSGWRSRVGSIVSEMERAVLAGGAVIILETLGTGSIAPSPPVRELAEYYRWLEDEQRFSRHEIQTDYTFPSAQEAAAVTGFFFGDELSDQIFRNDWHRLPEWTGVWWKSIPLPST